MPGVEVALAYALPVSAHSLAVRVQTHVEALPMLHTLRLCQRFGQGRFTDFPVEPVKMVERYAVEPVRSKVARDLAVASRCFRRKCSFLDHADRGELRKIYNGWVDKDMSLPGEFSEPSDGELLDLVGEVAMCGYSPYLEDLDEGSKHEANRAVWPPAVEKVFSREQQGFDSDAELGLLQTTITYLTLPGSVKQGHSWPFHETIEDTDGERTVKYDISRLTHPAVMFYGAST